MSQPPARVQSDSPFDPPRATPATAATEDARRVREELKVLLVERLRLGGVAPGSIGDDDSLVQGPLGLDSIDMLELALAVEQAYGVKIGDEMLERQAFRNISALAEFVCTERSQPDAEGSSTP